MVDPLFLEADGQGGWSGHRYWMGDYGAVEVVLLVERPGVGLGVALVVGGPSAEEMRPGDGVPVEGPLLQTAGSLGVWSWVGRQGPSSTWYSTRSIFPVADHERPETDWWPGVVVAGQGSSRALFTPMVVSTGPLAGPWGW